MEIKVDSDAVATVAAAAIFDHLGEEARNSIIKNAIEFLLTPEKDRGFTGSTRTTPLQNAFNEAIRSVSMKVVREKIENDPQITAEIEKLLGPLLNAAMNAEAEEFNYGLSEALGNALGIWLGEQARKSRER